MSAIFVDREFDDPRPDVSVVKVKQMEKSDRLVMNDVLRKYVMHPIDENGVEFSQIAHKYFSMLSQTMPNRFDVKDPHSLGSGGFDQTSFDMKVFRPAEMKKLGYDIYMDIKSSDFQEIDFVSKFNNFFDAEEKVSRRMVLRVGEEYFASGVRSRKDMISFFDNYYTDCILDHQSGKRHVFVVMGTDRYDRTKTTELRERLEGLARQIGVANLTHILIVHLIMPTISNYEKFYLAKTNPTGEQWPSILYKCMEKSIILTDGPRLPASIIFSYNSYYDSLTMMIGSQSSAFGIWLSTMREPKILIRQNVTLRYLPGVRSIKIFVRGRDDQRDPTCAYLRWLASTEIARGDVLVEDDMMSSKMRLHELTNGKVDFTVVMSYDKKEAYTFAQYLAASDPAVSGNVILIYMPDTESIIDLTLSGLRFVPISIPYEKPFFLYEASSVRAQYVNRDGVSWKVDDNTPPEVNRMPTDAKSSSTQDVKTPTTFARRADLVDQKSAMPASAMSSMSYERFPANNTFSKQFLDFEDYPTQVGSLPHIFFFSHSIFHLYYLSSQANLDQKLRAMIRY